MASTKGESNAKDLVLNTAVINSDVYLYAASAVNFTGANYDTAPNVGGKALTTGDYVKVGAIVSMALKAANGTAVITDATASATNVASGYEVGTADVTLTAAWTVTLNGITSVTIDTDGDVITNGMFVANNKQIDYDGDIVYAEGSPEHVIDTTAGNSYGAELSGNVTVSKDVTLSAATKITVTASSGITVYLKSSGASGAEVEIADDTTTKTICVLPGETIVVKDDDQAVVITDGSDPITEGVTTDPDVITWLQYVVDTIDVTLDDAT